MIFAFGTPDDALLVFLCDGAQPLRTVDGRFWGNAVLPSPRRQWHQKFLPSSMPGKMEQIMY